MAGGDPDPKVCRFCLDSRITSKNPLITPCECRGSIEFIHLICLNKWRNINPERNRDSCNLCMKEYTIPLIYDIETLPGDGTILYYILDSSFILNLFFYYIALIFYISSSHLSQFKSIFFIGESLYHILQVFMMYKFFNIRKKKEYFQHWRNERWILFPLHGIVFFLSGTQHPYFGVLVSSLFTNLYWMNHLEVIYVMNRDLEQRTE